MLPAGSYCVDRSWFSTPLAKGSGTEGAGAGRAEARKAEGRWVGRIRSCATEVSPEAEPAGVLLCARHLAELIQVSQQAQ